MAWDAETVNRRHLSVLKLFEKLQGDFPEEDLYERALRNYDLLLDILESPAAARAVSECGALPTEYVRDSADRVISLLLSNNDKNPFLALGLNAISSEEEVTTRWKKLISLFHPDRNPGSDDEEKAKLINEAYTRARSPAAREAFKPAPEKRPGNGTAKLQRRPSHKKADRHLRYAPKAIIILALSAAFLTGAVFILKKIEVRGPLPPPPIMRGAPEMAKSPPSAPPALILPEINPPDEVRKEEKKTPAPPAKRKEKARGKKRGPLRKNAPVKAGNPSRQERNIPVMEKSLPDEGPGEPAGTGGEGPLWEPENLTREFHSRLSPDLPPPPPYRPEIDFKKDNIVDEINALIKAFEYYTEKEELEGYLSLFADNALENGKEVSSLMPEYTDRFGRFDQKLVMSKIKIRIGNRDRAEISADYVLQRTEKEEGKNLLQEGKLKLKLERLDEGFRILHYEYD